MNETTDIKQNTFNKDDEKLLVDIIITVKNESKHIEKLLDSLVIQEPPVNIIIVDANSTDNTRQIIEKYIKKYDCINLYTHPGNRATGRNYGCRRGHGKIYAFIDGDCIADRNWVKEIRKHYDKTTVIAGKTISAGKKRYRGLERVELYVNGYDVTYPSTNLAYPADLFRKIDCFDVSFITAEDIDLNMNAIKIGGKIEYVDTVIVTHYARENIFLFIKQAFWNGYGRKQLTVKHGNLWRGYRPANMIKEISSMVGVIRIFFALCGYMVCKIKIQLKM
jgi:glycosyltransferase involved in cell wall biosynthesis